MSPALLHALARPFCLRVKGLARLRQAGRTLTGDAGNRCLTATPATKAVLWEVSPVRCCSGHTPFRQHTRHAGTNEEEDDGTGRSLTPQTKRANQTDILDTDAPDGFMLPSHYQRHQSDLLVAKIMECDSVKDAFEVYQRHREVMDAKHCLSLLRKLSDLVTCSRADSTELLQNEHFEALSGQLFVQCRRMELEDLLGVLKHLCRIGVPSSAKLTQAVFQMLKDQINDLSLKQIIFLDFLLKKMSLTPLSDALLTAIPILLSNALKSTPLADVSLADLSLAFTICCQGKVEGSGSILKEMYRRGSVKSVSSAMSLVWTLTQMSSPRVLYRFLSADEQLTRDVIMKECLETLARETTALTHQQIDSTLTKVSEGHSKGDRSCYNESFLQAVASYSCTNSTSFESLAHTMRKMISMNYLSDALVHHIVRCILSRPQEVPEARVTMLPLLSALAATTTLPPQDLKEALDVVMTHKTLRMEQQEYYRKPLLVVAVDLLCLGYFHPPLMDVLTSPDTLSMFMSKYRKEDNNHRRLLLVGQALSEVFQSPCRVPEAFLDPGRKILATLSPSRSSLKAMLLQVIQDPSCLVSGVLTEAGEYIDHLLVLDSEGVPVRLRSVEAPLMRNTHISTLDIPPAATKVAILDVGSSLVFRPTNALRGQQRLRQRILEAGGFKVLPVLQSIIFQHQEEEKLLYVKRELTSGGVVLS